MSTVSDVTKPRHAPNPPVMSETEMLAPRSRMRRSGPGLQFGGGSAA